MHLPFGMHTSNQTNLVIFLWLQLTAGCNWASPNQSSCRHPPLGDGRWGSPGSSSGGSSGRICPQPGGEGWGRGTQRTLTDSWAAPAGLRFYRQYLLNSLSRQRKAQGRTEGPLLAAIQESPSCPCFPPAGRVGGRWIAAGTPVPDPPDGALEPSPAPEAPVPSWPDRLAASVSNIKLYQASLWKILYSVWGFSAFKKDCFLHEEKAQVIGLNQNRASHQS